MPVYSDDSNSFEIDLPQPWRLRPVSSPTQTIALGREGSRAWITISVGSCEPGQYEQSSRLRMLRRITKMEDDRQVSDSPFLGHKNTVQAQWSLEEGRDSGPAGSDRWPIPRCRGLISIVTGPPSRGVEWAVQFRTEREHLQEVLQGLSSFNILDQEPDWAVAEAADKGSYGNAWKKGFFAGLIMSLGYIFVFALALWSEWHGYTLVPDPINNPTRFVLVIYVVCQVVGLSLLGRAFQPIRNFWKWLMCVVVGFAMCGIITLSLTVFRRPEVLPFLMYGCVGGALGWLAARGRGTAFASASLAGAYFVATYLEHTLSFGEAVRNHILNLSRPQTSIGMLSTSPVAGSVSQVFINVVFATLAALCLEALSMFRKRTRISHLTSELRHTE